ncbi:MAG: hypothetical protein SNG35_03745, partial [Rikenellaceae bacterium]
MKRFLLLLVLMPYLLCVKGQEGGTQGREESRLLESVYYKSNSDVAPSEELPKVKGLIENAVADSTLMLHLVG